MISGQTILYIGSVDKHYRNLCNHTIEDGYTIVQLSNYASVIKLIDALDVFIVIRADNPSQESSSETVQALNESCLINNIALVEIQNEIISVSQLTWQQI